jgi:hypothetical protein
MTGHDCTDAGMLEQADAVYVYAVVPRRARAPAAAAILPGAAIEVLPAGRVAALISRVPRGGFAASDDADWMAARALAHHAVIVAACSAAPCLPFAFGALFSEARLIVDWLREREAPLAAALDRTADAAEWIVTLAEDAGVHAAWLEANDTELAGMAATAAAAGEGTGFLLRRRLDRLRAAACAARRTLLGTRISAVLSRHAAIVAGQAASPGRWTVLVDAELLPAMRTELAALAAEVDGSGLSISLGGPWPPYGFAREVTAHD